MKNTVHAQLIVCGANVQMLATDTGAWITGFNVSKNWQSEVIEYIKAHKITIDNSAMFDWL